MPMGVEITARLETACQDLLRSETVVNGWLRRKRKLHHLSETLDQKLKGNNFENLSTLLSWERIFVVLKDGFAYFFNSETAKRASRVVDLGLFESVHKVEHIKAKDVAWPFKVVGTQVKKALYLSASSQDDQQHWIEALKKAIDEAEVKGRRPQPQLQQLQHQQTSSSSPSERSRASVSSDDDSVGDDYVDIDENLPKANEKKAEGKKGDGCAEYESQSGFMPSKEQKSRDRPMPPVPADIDDGKPKARPTPATKPKPAVEKKISEALSNTAGIQPLPRKFLTKQNSHVRGEGAEDEGGKIEYERVEENLYSQALWTKNAEEGVQLMRKLGEDGVFMIRQSSSGKEDQTLQVIAKGELKKYKIITEGGRCKMAGGMDFGDILELLKYYQTHTIPNYDTKLKKPYKDLMKS